MWSATRRFVSTRLWGRCPYMLLIDKDWKLAHTFESSFRYMNDVLSLNNSWFGDYLHRIYPNELEVKDTTDTQRSASYLVLHIEIDNGWRLKRKLYDKRDDFTFPIVNFPFISSNIPASPAYGVYISQFTDSDCPFGIFKLFLYFTWELVPSTIF